MTQLTLNLIQGSVSFKFTPEAAKNLQESIQSLIDDLKNKSPQPQSRGNKHIPKKPMEYHYTGDVFLEVFCNPNIYPSPFAAKVLLTIRDDRIRLTSEAELTRLIEDLDNYLQNSQ